MPIDTFKNIKADAEESRDDPFVGPTLHRPCHGRVAQVVRTAVVDA